jgi:hypothetical protein
MPFNMVAQRVFETRIKYVQNGQLIQNIFHGVLKDAQLNDFTGAIASDDFAQAIADFWKAYVTVFQSTTMEAAEIEVLQVVRVDPGDDAGGEAKPPKVVYSFRDILELSPQYNGENPGEAMPSYVAATIQKRATQDQAAHFGSMRLGGLMEAHTTLPDMNELEANIKLSIGLFALELTKPLVVGQISSEDVVWLWSVFSRTEAVGKADPYPHCYRITDVRVNDVLGSQVSRKKRQLRL